MRARDVMTQPVITVQPRTPLHAAAALLVAHGFTAVPVVDDNGLIVGIATEADLMRGQVLPEGWERSTRPEPLVAEVMTRVPLAMRPEDDLADLVAAMLDLRIRSVPIVDDGTLVGIVSRRDVLRCVARRELTSTDVAARRAVAGVRAPSRSARGDGDDRPTQLR